MSDYKVFIGYPTPGYSKNDTFYDYFNALIKPDGTILSGAHGQSPARNRNILIKKAIEKECTHILFLDDDTAFPNDMLIRLLAHDKDIVSAFYLMRSFPHKPIVFHIPGEDGHITKHYYPEDNGLHEVGSMGLGACLIKLDVFKQMEYPWIRLGEIETDHWCDDLGFFNRAIKKGYKLFCDFSISVGHLASCTIIPIYKNGQWTVAIDTGGTQAVTIPMGLDK